MRKYRTFFASWAPLFFAVCAKKRERREKKKENDRRKNVVNSIWLLYRGHLIKIKKIIGAYMWLYAYTVVVLAILAHVINKEKKLCEKKNG